MALCSRCSQRCKQIVYIIKLCFLWIMMHFIFADSWCYEQLRCTPAYFIRRVRETWESQQTIYYTMNHNHNFKKKLYMIMYRKNQIYKIINDNMPRTPLANSTIPLNPWTNFLDPRLSFGVGRGGIIGEFNKLRKWVIL